MLNTDDLRYYTGIGTGYSPEMMMQRAADEIDRLRKICMAAKEALYAGTKDDFEVADMLEAAFLTPNV